MKKIYLILFGVIAIMSLSSSACSIGIAPECTDMAAPIPINPGNAIASTGTPVSFQWLHSGTCNPNGFRIIVSKIRGDPGFYGSEYSLIDNRIPAPIPTTLVYTDGSTARGYGWTSSQVLSPGIYYWRVIPYSGDFHGERSEWEPFTVYKDCPHAEDFNLPANLVSPNNGQTVYQNTPLFLWTEPNTCGQFWWGSQYYNLWISKYADFPEGDTIKKGTHWTYVSEIELENCSHYYWQVVTILDIATVEANTSLFFSDIRQFDVASEDGGPCEPVPPVPTQEFSTGQKPLAEMIQNTNCRTGPTTEYSIMDTIDAQTQYEIRARNPLGSAWQIFDTQIGRLCWVKADLVRVTGDITSIEIIDPTPPSLELIPSQPESGSQTTINCSSFNQDPNGCANTNVCWWDPSVLPNGVCKKK